MPSRTAAQRQVRPTALIYCEGAHDITFVRHVLNLYRLRSAMGASITPRQGRGGSPDGLVRTAIGISQGYDRKMVKLDHDRDAAEIEEAIRLAANDNVILNFSYPCLDALLLSILDPGTNHSNWSSSRCKSRFESEYIPERRRTFIQPYGSLFTLEVLEEARIRIPELDDLLKFVEA